MTIHQFPGPNDRRPAAPETRPRRSGEPWTTADYELLVRRCREGASGAELAAALERSDRAVLGRAKRLLPLDQRGLPEDRIIPHLHRLLSDDADYDWAHHLAATPPPRPVINHLPAPEVRRGIPGLSDRELLSFASWAVRLGTDHGTDDLRREVADQVDARDLHDEFSRRLERDSSALLDEFLWASRGYGYALGWDPTPPPYGMGMSEEPPPHDLEPPEEFGW